MTDQQSADAMSCRMGGKYISTPAIDSLASQGVTFTRAYTPNPLCVPARTSIFTGEYPHVTGVQTNDDRTQLLSGRFRCLGRYFRDAGYETAFAGKWHLPYPETDSAAHGFQELGPLKKNGVDREIPPFALEFLQRRREAPFFLVTSFVNPHNICEWARGEGMRDGDIGTPPRPALCPPGPENRSPVRGDADIMTLMRRSYQANRLFPVGGFDEDKWRAYRWSYYRMIETVDAHIGTILEALHRSGKFESTLIVFTSDHGDMQGEHGWNQKTVLYDRSTRVPLIISGPGQRMAGISSRLVNTGIDLVPTLCDFAGIARAERLPGLTLRPVVTNPAEPDARKYVVVENKMVQGSPVDGWKPEPAGRMVRSAHFAYYAYDLGALRECLIDMDRDPAESVNLATTREYRTDLEMHRAYLFEWARANNDRFDVPR